MTAIDTIKALLKKHKALLQKKYKVKEIGIFGSYIRGEQQERSDIDLLVDFTDSVSLLEFVHLENFLSDILGAKVDLVMKTALKPRIGKHILEEVVPV